MHMPKMVMNATNILEKKGIFDRDTLHRFLGPFCLLQCDDEVLEMKKTFLKMPHPTHIVSYCST